MRSEVRAGRRGGVARRRRERHARREGPAVKAWGARACAERTSNMRYMSVTLDVSKLSGWLNAAVFCRVERRGVRCGARCGPGGGGGVGWRQRTSGMHGERARL